METLHIYLYRDSLLDMKKDKRPQNCAPKSKVSSQISSCDREKAEFWEPEEELPKGRDSECLSHSSVDVSNVLGFCIILPLKL